METLRVAVPQTENRERRRHQRYRVKDGGIALLTPPGPLSTVVGQILDISSHGLSFRYVADEAMPRSISKVTIALPESRFYLKELPIETVSDYEIAKLPFGSLSPRRHSLKFGTLTPSQKSELKQFMTQHAEFEG